MAILWNKFQKKIKVAFWSEMARITYMQVKTNAQTVLGKNMKTTKMFNNISVLNMLWLNWFCNICNNLIYKYDLLKIIFPFIYLDVITMYF